MPTLSIYLPRELYDLIKDAPSMIVKTALQAYFKNESHQSKRVEKMVKK